MGVGLNAEKTENAENGTEQIGFTAKRQRPFTSRDRKGAECRERLGLSSGKTATATALNGQIAEIAENGVTWVKCKRRNVFCRKGLDFCRAG